MTNISWFKRNKIPYLIFIFGWLVLNLIQAYFTQLHYDEAYYWVYSQKLAWGYFDHPPMVAFLVKVGYSLFQNELGVRLFFVIMGTSTMAMIIYLIKETQKLSLLFIFLLSIPLIHFHVSGFIATPDIPLVFFATLFFVLYKKFIEENTYSLALLIGVVAAAMLYSKYHGVLILTFTLLSNIKLLKNKKVWVALLVMVTLMLPHLYWQVSNHFPTLNFQVSGRIKGIESKYIFDYLGGQLIMPGLLTGIIALFLVIKYKSEDQFDKTLKLNIYGFLMFFFAFSFRMGIEAHWTAAILPALAVISFKSLQKREKLIKWFVPLALVGIIALFFGRIVIINDSIAKKLPIISNFNYWKHTVEKFKEISENKKVIFVSNYQYAAEYSFYTKKITPSLAMIGYRFSHFDFNHFDEIYKNKDVVIIEEVSNEYKGKAVKIKPNNTFRYTFIKNYTPFHQIDIKCNTKSISGRPRDTTICVITVKNTSSEKIIFNSNPQLLPSICYEISGSSHEEWYKQIQEIINRNYLDPKEEMKLKIPVVLPKEPGQLMIRFHVSYGATYRGTSSELIKINEK